MIGLNPVKDDVDSTAKILDMFASFRDRWEVPTQVCVLSHVTTAMEARCYGFAKNFSPFLVNTVVGFIGPEYLYDARQVIRAGLEDHFMGKLTGVPMGCDACLHMRLTGPSQARPRMLNVQRADMCFVKCSGEYNVWQILYR